MIQSLYEAFPDALSKQNEYGATPLSLAVYWDASLDVLQFMLKESPETVHLKDEQGQDVIASAWHLFVHRVNDSKEEKRRVMYNRRIMNAANAPYHLDGPVGDWWEAMELLLKVAYHGTVEDPLPGGKMWRALHAACGLDVPNEVMLFALQIFSRQKFVQDELGRLPLHILAGRPTYIRQPFESERTTPSFLRLLKSNVRGTKVLDRLGRLPLHIAAASSRTWEDGIKDLVEIEPRALRTRDWKQRMYPFMLAAMKNKNQLMTKRRNRAERRARNKFNKWKSLPSEVKETELRDLMQEEEISEVDTVYNLLRAAPDLIEVGVSKLLQLQEMQEKQQRQELLRQEKEMEQELQRKEKEMEQERRRQQQEMEEERRRQQQEMEEELRRQQQEMEEVKKMEEMEDMKKQMQQLKEMKEMQKQIQQMKEMEMHEREEKLNKRERKKRQANKTHARKAPSESRDDTQGLKFGKQQQRKGSEERHRPKLRANEALTVQARSHVNELDEYQGGDYFDGSEHDYTSFVEERREQEYSHHRDTSEPATSMNYHLATASPRHRNRSASPASGSSKRSGGSTSRSNSSRRSDSKKHASRTGTKNEMSSPSSRRTRKDISSPSTRGKKREISSPSTKPVHLPPKPKSPRAMKTSNSNTIKSVRSHMSSGVSTTMSTKSPRGSSKIPPRSPARTGIKKTTDAKNRVVTGSARDASPPPSSPSSRKKSGLKERSRSPKRRGESYVI